MNDLMIKVDHISKEYMLGQIGGTTLRDELQRFHARVHGKEDPTKRIGAREIAVRRRGGSGDRTVYGRGRHFL